MTNKLPKIILLSGLKRSGKDTFANYLHNNYDYHHLKITSKLKDCIKLLFGLEDEDFEQKKEELNPNWNTTSRRLMQFIGTDIFQYKIQELIPHIGRNFWIKSLFNEELIYNLINNENYRIVISDLRFLHEYSEIEKLNIPFIHIRINNQNLDSEVDTHISETELYDIPYNYEIKNDSSLDVFYSKISSLIYYLK
tara:strand:- start:885 stop:1469 length:585 start_codon:yes stop_codon:yes gene_type:complete